MWAWTGARLPAVGLCVCVGLLGACTAGDGESAGGSPAPVVTEQSPSSGDRGTSTASPAVETEQVGSFQVMQSPDDAGWWMPEEARAVFYPVRLAHQFRAEDDPCDNPQFIPDRLLPRPPGWSEGLKGLNTDGPLRGPYGIRLVYRGQAAQMQEAFERIAEQMALCAADVTFREEGHEGRVQVRMLDLAEVGDEQVAARVLAVGSGADQAGAEAEFYWIGFARDGDTFAAVQLCEVWGGSDAEDLPEQYPQPTLADEELTTQLAAALKRSG